MLIKQSRLPINKILLTGWMPSRLKVAYYRTKGAYIGEGVKIGLGTVILADKLKIGDHTSIGFGTVIRGRDVHIGSYTYIGSTVILDVEKIHIGDDAKINEQVFAGGPMFPDSYLHIGSRTTVMQHTFLNPSKPLIIRDGAGIGGRCSIFTHSSWQNMFSGYPVKFAPVEIGENAWVPWDVFIMPGVKIGNGATIGAGSLVISEVPARSLAVGMPAKILRTEEQYVTPPSLDRQNEMMNTIFDEFFEYLEYHRFQVSEFPIDVKTVRFHQVSDSKGIILGEIIFRSSGDYVINDDQINPSSVFLSLTHINSAERSKFNNRGSLWIDIPKIERNNNSNAVGEQLIDFLKRYGLHLKRK